MAGPELDPAAPPGLYLVSAFFAMEASDSLISLSRGCGGGSVTVEMQRFIWDHCISRADGKCHSTYLKNFVKKLISEAESNHDDVLDELYEFYALCLTSQKDDSSMRENSKVSKCISFLFPQGDKNLASPNPRKLDFLLQCSLNMLEGDTGCSIWPSSLFLSEFILSFPEIFSNKSCFEVGSGVGLVGLCLAHVQASQVILSDGDLSTLANMKLNLEMNHPSCVSDVAEKPTRKPNSVECIHLPWESASESGLLEFKPEIVLGADVIYDPLCLPHLVRVFSILLKKGESCTTEQEGSHRGSSLGSNLTNGGVREANQDNISSVYELGRFGSAAHENGHESKSLHDEARDRNASTVAYVASVIRNVETFNHFLALADDASLKVEDLTETHKPLDLLPYMMQSYQRNRIKLFKISCM